MKRQLLNFARQVLMRYREDRCLQLASSLTFTTLLSLVPLLTVMLTMASAFPAFSGLTGQIDDFIASHVLPEQIGKTVLRYVDQFSQRAGRLTLIGLGFLAATSFLTMLTIERSFNIIWRGAAQRPVLQRVIVYWAILTLGPVLIGASVTMTSYLVTASLGIAKAIPLLGVVALWLVPFMLTIAAFTLLYYVVPTRSIEISHAFIGGLVAGILFELAKRGFAIYVSRVPTYTMVYGTFATFPIFLLWIYLSWLVTVLGAIVTASMPDFGIFPQHSTPPAGAGFVQALDVLLILGSAHADGVPCTSRTIAARAMMPLDKCEQLLGSLGVCGWVGKMESGHWTLTCAPDHIKVSDVFRHLVIAPEALAEAQSRPELSALFGNLSASFDGMLEMSLADLASGKHAE